MRCRDVFLVLLATVLVACTEGDLESVDASANGPDRAATTTTAEPTTTIAAPPSTLAPTTTTSQPAQSGVEGLEFDYLDPATFPDLVLVESGAEPRQVRSWMPPVGTRVAMTITLGSQSTQSGGGVDSITTSFTATIGATTEVVAITDEGFVARTVFDSSTVESSEPFTQGLLESAYAELIGVEVHQLTRPDGAIIAQAGVEALGEGLLGNGLGGIATPLPTQPIGIGAVWTTDQVIEVEGIRIGQTVTTRLVDIQGDVLTVEIDATSSLKPGGAEEPASISLSGTSTGTAVWDLAVGMPISASSRSVQDVESTNPDDPFSVRTVTTIEISTEPLD